jgi:hypothetical protein
MKYSYHNFLSFSNKHKESFGRENLECKMTELEGRDIDYWDFCILQSLEQEFEVGLGLRRMMSFLNF